MSDEFKEIKDAFNTISPLLEESDWLKPAGGKDVGRFKEVTFGEGSNVFRADNQGMWLGAETFGAAPFRVDMNGNLYLLSQTSSGYLMLDAENSRIIVNDGENDRIVLGNQENGF